MPSSVTSNSFTSWRLAPLTISESGAPTPSTNRLRFVPFFPPIRWIGSHGFLCEWGFAHGAVDTLPSPRDPFHLVVFRQTCLPQAQEEPIVPPPLEVLMDGAAAAKIIGERLPLTARAQDIDNRREDLSRRDRFPPATSQPAITASRSPLPWIVLGQERLRFGPEFIRDFPRLHRRHGQNLRMRRNRFKFYLRISSKHGPCRCR